LTLSALPTITLFLHARLANMRLALDGRTTSLPLLEPIRSTSSSKSARGDVRASGLGLVERKSQREREGRTASVEDRVLADGLRDELDALADVGVLVDEDVESIEAQEVDVLHGHQLIGRREVEDARAADEVTARGQRRVRGSEEERGGRRE